MNSAKNPRQLDRVILTPRGEGMAMPVGPMQSGADTDEDEPTPPAPEVGAQPPPATPPEGGMPQRPPAPPYVPAVPEDESPEL